MRELRVKIIGLCEIDIPDIAEQFAELTSEEQVIFLEEMFDALNHRCGNKANFESQLWHIANGSKKGFHKNLEYVFETLNYFIKFQPTKETERESE